MDGQTDRQTNRFAISISRDSMLTRDKNDVFAANTGQLLPNCFSHAAILAKFGFSSVTD